MAANPGAVGAIQLPQKLMEIQGQLERNTDEIKKIEAEYQKVLQGKKSLTEKKSENEMVMAEFNLLTEESGATVYKLVGPVLAK